MIMRLLLNKNVFHMIIKNQPGDVHSDVKLGTVPPGDGSEAVWDKALLRGPHNCHPSLPGAHPDAPPHLRPHTHTYSRLLFHPN